MGLDCSHDAFQGPYSSFNRFRQCVTKALGAEYSFPPHIDNKEYEEEFIYLPDNLKSDMPGIYEFLTHSDCEGNISPNICACIANELTSLLPEIDNLDKKYSRCSYFARKFIKGCEAAFNAKEPLEFF